MKLNKENYGLIPILALLVYWIGLFFYQLTFGAPYSIMRINLTFGPIFEVFLILIVAATVSIFIEYKFNWIVTSLPFLWYLLLPLKVDIDNYRGILINLFNYPSLFFMIILAALPYLLAVIYLYIKNLKKIESKKFEIAFAVAIAIFFILKLII